MTGFKSFGSSTEEISEKLEDLQEKILQNQDDARNLLNDYSLDY